MKKIISCCFVFLLMQCVSMNAQSLEVGVGFSPIFVEGISINSFNSGYGPSTNSITTISSGVMTAFNLNLGMYFNLINRFQEFSAGVQYQWIPYVGIDNSYEDLLVAGLDLPIFGCVRAGYTSGDQSRSNIGASFGAGIIYSMLSIGGQNAYNKLGFLAPAFNAGVSIRDVGGFEVTSSFKGYQTYYETNTGDIPRRKYTTLHLSIYYYLGTW